MLFALATSCSSYENPKDHELTLIQLDGLALHNHRSRLVKSRLCLNVTFEGMTLVDCRSRSPQVKFEPGQTSASAKSYERLIEFGHANMGREPEELPVVVEGVYEKKESAAGLVRTFYINRLVRTNW